MNRYLPVALCGLFALSSPGQAALPQWYLDGGLPASDTDGDGIPDAWERRTFGDPAAPDSQLDRDGDGLSDLEEFACGSDPRSASTGGDLWTDREKRDAGLDAAARVVPAADLAQWLAFTGWSSAEGWRWMTAADDEGFAAGYADFVHATAPYCYTNSAGVIDFWLSAHTDRPAWLTVADARTTNSFPLPPGDSLRRLRVAVNRPVSLTLDPHPGALLSLPGATNGMWLCRLEILPVYTNTLVFREGETPEVPPFDPPQASVDGLLLTLPPPDSPFIPLAGAEPAPAGPQALSAPAGGRPPGGSTGAGATPIRVTRGVEHLGPYCLCGNEECPWPECEDFGADVPGGVSVNGAPLGNKDSPLISREYAATYYSEHLPTPPRNWVDVPLDATASAYPFLYGTVLTQVEPCGARSGAFGAEQWAGRNLAPIPHHEKDHHPRQIDDPVDCLLCGRHGGPVSIFGFGHDYVPTRDLTHPDEQAPGKFYSHCLGIVWSRSPFVLTNICASFGVHLGDTVNWRINGKTQESPNLSLGREPSDLEPDIYWIEMIFKGCDDDLCVCDKLVLVVNSPDSRTEFDSWYADNADMSWTTNLPKPFASIAVTVSNGTTNCVDPEPNWFGGQWGSPHSINSYLHHDAKYEMRSGPVSGGYGHQATYTAKGILITSPIAAGTADISAPYYANDILNTFGTFKHREQDVYPFIRALQLDGNPVHPNNKFAPTNLNRPCIYRGANTDRYVRRRPVLP
jgi:hypothetical protein